MSTLPIEHLHPGTVADQHLSRSIDAHASSLMQLTIAAAGAAECSNVDV
jgi:hypothetical protein